MDRGFTFSDDRVIDLLKTKFVPAVGNTHELQNQQFASSKWFLGMAKRANPRIEQRHTAQGFYVAGADGRAYGFNNNRSVDRVLDFMQKGLTAYRNDPPTKVEITDDEVEAKFCRAPDPSVSVVRVFSRIKPLPKDADVLNSGVGRDHFWVYPEDVAAILVRSQSKFRMPREMEMRLARFHMVDNVRGEPDFWRREQVKKAEFYLDRTGPGEWKVSGDFSMDNGRQGMEGKLTGVVRVSGDKLTDLRLFARAKAWGSGNWTPRAPAGKFPILFAAVMATDETSRVVPPQAAQYGDGEYRKPSTP